MEPLGKVGIARESCLWIRGSWPRQELLKAGGQELLGVKLRETSIGHHAVFMMLWVDDELELKILTDQEFSRLVNTE